MSTTTQWDLLQEHGRLLDALRRSLEAERALFHAAVARAGGDMHARLADILTRDEREALAKLQNDRWELRQRIDALKQGHSLTS